LSALGRGEEALASLDAALALRPGDAQSWYNRGNTLRALARHEEALAAYDRALAIRPGDARTLNNKGVAWNALGRFDTALAVYELGLTLHPEDGELWFNRGVALQLLKRHDAALASHDRALALDPAHDGAFREAAVCAMYLCEWPRMAEIRRLWPSRPAAMQPWTLIGYGGDPRAQLECARRAARVLPRGPALWSGERYRHDRIRIAYLSADFRNHPVAVQLAQHLEQHDRSRFEIVGVSSGADDGSAVRTRVAAAMDTFHDVRGVPPRRVAERLRALEIDIALDLDGHTEGNALAVLAHRPAPLQVSWLGYPGTTGADFIDHVLADAIAAPPSHQPFYSETLLHLPAGFFPLDTTRAIGAAPGRAEAGLPATGFVFCCFNNNWKIAPSVFDIWMRLLAQVPGSVLWLRQGAEQTLRREAAARGIAPERLVFAAPEPDSGRHLARQTLADLFLDTLPYNAHATAADALWAGLPVITQLGDAFAGRVAASLVTAAGLPELVTHSAENYEALALALARDPVRLKDLRDRLAANHATAPLFDTARLTRDIETAFAAMLEKA
ncbi:MAG TPA: tetratricopeptide repeat protein, partial [Rhizomicrobium sp.]